SSMVLTLALPGDASATGQVLAAADAGSEPVWLTLRQLVRTPPQWRGVDTVLVVENPSVVALAADALGAGRPPIVCTNGQPRAAAMVLLRSLTAAGVRLLHHGDFDWGGIAIGNLLHRRLPVEPWQFDRDAYLRAVADHPHAARLTGPPASASWDSGLAEAMREAGRRIEEELVAADLLETLQATTTVPEPRGRLRGRHTDRQEDAHPDEHADHKIAAALTGRDCEHEAGTR
ncbi:MAG: DUF2399 domain-containing protein, partial [Actinomycetota bacterium]|nr:DUF2399 domain-containing protein [Actinomycetota bacterium]